MPSRIVRGGILLHNSGCGGVGSGKAGRGVPGKGKVGGRVFLSDMSRRLLTRRMSERGGEGEKGVGERF